MGSTIEHMSRDAWRLVARQHGLVARRQRLELGFSRQQVEHRLRSGRLYSVLPGVYAVGRPELTKHGRWMAAVLRCGPAAALSHRSAAALWGIRKAVPKIVEVSVPASVARRPCGLRVRRRRRLAERDRTVVHGIPVTDIVTTLIDIAPLIAASELERAINEADKLDLIRADQLRDEVERRPRSPGGAILRRMLDRHTFVLTDSELERLFLPIARRAGLPKTVTRRRLDGHRVDFYWPDLDLVVETDGLRYHRTAVQQARDAVRFQDHVVAERTVLRFTHAQVRYEPARVETVLREVVRRLNAATSAA